MLLTVHGWADRWPSLSLLPCSPDQTSTWEGHKPWGRYLQQRIDVYSWRATAGWGGTRTRFDNSMLSVGLATGWSWVRIPLRKLRFGTLAIPFTPLCHCLSEETLKSRRSLLSGVYARGSKRSHQSALEMCNLSWTPPLLEKDNSKNNPVYNTQVWFLHSIGRKKERKNTARFLQTYV